MNEINDKLKTKCASCLFNFEIDNMTFIGELIVCPNCGTELVIIEKIARTEVYTGPEGSL